ncbi:hypothetical protein BLOT_013612 [Blomia tropicalis]|nr:hypothetical protein BLOT_013612 [Blomia tropicalis]
MYRLHVSISGIDSGDKLVHMSNTLGCVPIAGIAVPSHLQKERANCATNGTIGTGDCPNGLVAINNIGVVFDAFRASVGHHKAHALGSKANKQAESSELILVTGTGIAHPASDRIVPMYGVKKEMENMILANFFYLVIWSTVFDPNVGRAMNSLIN